MRSDVTCASYRGLRVLELYAGIGGCAAAVRGRADVLAAVDQNRQALAVYRHNFSHRTLPQTVESLPGDVFADADLWWLSPPCQPYTRRGLGRDLADPRAASLPTVLRAIQEHRPRYVALENVPPFQDSQTRTAILETLLASGYAIRECVLCPTELGWPNRRRRYYLVAARGELRPWPAGRRDSSWAATLRDLIDEAAGADLWVSPELLAQYAGALDIVDAGDPLAATSCFTAAYGRSPVRSGSYLRTGRGVRRFSPREILRLLGFPPAFDFPRGLSARDAWPLVGNSLSVPAVQWVLSCVPELGNRHALRAVVG